LIFEDTVSNMCVVLYKEKPPNVVFQGINCKCNPILNTHEFDLATKGGIHHQLCCLEDVNNQQGFQCEFLLETCQVISFFASNVEFFYNYYFDYGGLGNKTCIWIDYRPSELLNCLSCMIIFLSLKCA